MCRIQFVLDSVSVCVRVCVSIDLCDCPRCKRKTAWAIDTKLVAHVDAWPRYALSLRSKRQRSKSQGYEVCCRRGYACRYDSAQVDSSYVVIGDVTVHQQWSSTPVAGRAWRHTSVQQPDGVQCPVVSSRAQPDRRWLVADITKCRRRRFGIACCRPAESDDVGR